MKCWRAGWAHVAAVSEGGIVLELLFVKDGDERVLLVVGEELVGARQNRILNMSVITTGSCTSALFGVRGRLPGYVVRVA